MKKLIIISALFIFAACSQNISNDNFSNKLSKPTVKSCTTTDPGVGFFGNAGWGNHFKTWLQNNGYSDLASIEGWGGKQYSSDCDAYYQPVIFIHGNGDYAQDWDDVRDDYLEGNGSDVYYYPSELYAIGYGDKGALNASYNHHKADHMQRIRRLIAAVKAYTGATKVDVVTHSLGVTISRKAIKGGYAYNTADRSGTAIYLGSSISSNIDTFVGIAGANRGLNSCGTWPANISTDTCEANGLSKSNPFLNDLGTGGSEGSYTFSIKSWVDEVVCATGTCYVDGQHSSYINGEDGTHEYSSYPYGHFNSKNYSADYQIDMIFNHETDGSY